MIKSLQEGKRYEWWTSSIGGCLKSGLFTGEYLNEEKTQGKFITRNGEEWCLSVNDVNLVNGKKVETA